MARGRSAVLLIASALLLGACKGGTSEHVQPVVEDVRNILPEGELTACLNPALFATGSTWTARWIVRRHEPTMGFYAVTFGITETHEVLGAASFNGEANALQVRVSSVGEDIGAAEVGDVRITDEPESFTGEFRVYYALDLAQGQVRYLGAERETGGAFEAYELADPPELRNFDLGPGESVEQAFALTTEGIAREKETAWTYDGQGEIGLRTGLATEACQVSGVGHEPSLFVPTPRSVIGEESGFEILFARGTGIPVYLSYTDDTNFPLDPVMEMRLIEAFIDGERVH